MAEYALCGPHTKLLVTCWQLKANAITLSPSPQYQPGGCDDTTAGICFLAAPSLQDCRTVLQVKPHGRDKRIYIHITHVHVLVGLLHNAPVTVCAPYLTLAKLQASTCIYE